jgi:hypothetical protein
LEEGKVRGAGVPDKFARPYQPRAVSNQFIAAVIKAGLKDPGSRNISHILAFLMVICGVLLDIPRLTRHKIFLILMRYFQLTGQHLKSYPQLLTPDMGTTRMTDVTTR